jgi:heat shock protein HspQ
MNPLSKPKNKLPVFCIGDVVRHRLYPFRGVIVDVDPEFDNTEEWYAAIPEDIRPEREQPFYYLLAENSETYYSAYVSQQNLLSDTENGRSIIQILMMCLTGLKKGDTSCAPKPIIRA